MDFLSYGYCTVQVLVFVFSGMLSISPKPMVLTHLQFSGHSRLPVSLCPMSVRLFYFSASWSAREERPGLNSFSSYLGAHHPFPISPWGCHTCRHSGLILEVFLSSVSDQILGLSLNRGSCIYCFFSIFAVLLWPCVFITKLLGESPRRSMPGLAHIWPSFLHASFILYQRNQLLAKIKRRQ